LRCENRSANELQWRFGQERARGRNVACQGVARVILDPLTEIGIGMFVAVVVGGRQLVVNLQGRRERHHREEHAREEQSNDSAGIGMRLMMHRYPESPRINGVCCNKAMV
jgi:hypothetical protein